MVDFGPLSEEFGKSQCFLTDSRFTQNDLWKKSWRSRRTCSWRKASALKLSRGSRRDARSSPARFWPKLTAGSRDPMRRFWGHFGQAKALPQISRNFSSSWPATSASSTPELRMSPRGPLLVQEPPSCCKSGSRAFGARGQPPISLNSQPKFFQQFKRARRIRPADNPSRPCWVN